VEGERTGQGEGEDEQQSSQCRASAEDMDQTLPHLNMRTWLATQRRPVV